MKSKNIELHWAINALLEKKSLQLVVRDLIEDWVIDPVVCATHLVLAIAFVGPLECMQWAVKGSLPVCRKDGQVAWYPSEETYHLWVRSASRSDHAYWPYKDFKN